MTQNNNCFFKVMIGNFTKTIRIPPLFVREFSGQFPQEIMLSCGEVRLWRIHVVKGDQGYSYFDSGWSVFVQDNGLELGDFLVFRYTEKLRFDVEIFEPSGCLKEITVDRPRSSQCVRNRDSSDSDPDYDSKSESDSKSDYESDSEPGSGGGLKGCMRFGPVPKPVSGLAAEQATKGTSVSKKHSEQLASMPRTHKSVPVKDISVMKGSETPNAMPKPVSGLAAVRATKGTSVSNKHSEQLASMPRTQKSVLVKDISVMKGSEIRNATPLVNESSGSLLKKRSRISSEGTSMQKKARKVEEVDAVEEVQPPKFTTKIAPVSSSAAGNNKEPGKEEVSVKDSSVMKGSETPNATPFENVSLGSMSKKRSRISSEARNVQKKALKLEEDSVEKVQPPKITTKVAPASIRRNVKVESSAAGYKEPSEDEVYETVVDFLMEDDHCAVSVSNILRKLGTHFGVNLRHRKAEVESIVDKFVFMS